MPLTPCLTNRTLSRTSLKVHLYDSGPQSYLVANLILNRTSAEVNLGDSGLSRTVLHILLRFVRIRLSVAASWHNDSLLLARPQGNFVLYK